MIKQSDTARGGRCSCLLLDRDVMALSPALLPGGLCVILKPVIYELVLYILLKEPAAVLTSLQLLVDGLPTSDGCTEVPLSPAFVLCKYSI